MIDPLGSRINIPRGDQDTDILIARKACSEANRTLEVRIGSDGSWKSELKFLQSTAKKFAVNSRDIFSLSHNVSANHVMFGRNHLVVPTTVQTNSEDYKTGMAQCLWFQ